jgi:hypothetical protein
MKFGFRNPSLSKRNAVRTSLKRAVRHNLGVKAPKGFGWLKDPKKAAYIKVYKKTSRGSLVQVIFIAGMAMTYIFFWLVFVLVRFVIVHRLLF